ncbi:MAG: YaiO family outer membrane beta-barrel protein [Nitrospinae bacterium]|nr:YaiO family outer membrane beta-barrel protein [Nitrospinota bacterium]
MAAGYTYERLTNGYKDWRSAWLRASRTGAGGVLYGAARHTERFGLDDSEFQAGLSLPFAAPFSLTVEAGASPSHKVLPRWTALTELGVNAAGWGLSAGYRRTEYDHSRTDMGIFRLERYVGDLRAAYTFYPVSVESAGSASGHALRLDWFYSDAGFIGLGYAMGREVESAGAAGLLVSDITEYAVIGRHEVTREWAVLFEAGTHRQAPYYTRDWASLGIGRVF